MKLYAALAAVFALLGHHHVTIWLQGAPSSIPALWLVAAVLLGAAVVLVVLITRSARWQPVSWNSQATP